MTSSVDVNPDTITVLSTPCFMAFSIRRSTASLPDIAGACALTRGSDGSGYPAGIFFKSSATAGSFAPSFSPPRGRITSAALLHSFCSRCSAWSGCHSP